MSKKADPKMIGAFVVGAAVLVVVGLMVFGWLRSSSTSCMTRR